MVELVHGLVGADVDLGLHDGLGQRHVGLLEEGVEHAVARLAALLHLLHPGEAGAQVVLELVERVELAGELGELVVGLGELALLDLRDGDRDLGLLAGVLTGHERRRELLRLAGAHALERLVEALDELAGADLVGHARGLRLLDGLAVDGGGEVDDDEVAALRGPLDAGERAETRLQARQLLVDVVVGDLGRVDRHGDGRVVRHRDLGTDVDLGREGELVAVPDLGDLDVGLAERLDLGLLDGLAVLGGHGLVDDLFEHDPTTEALVEDAGGRLPGPEARDAHLLRDLLVGPVEVGLELVEGHLDGEFDARRRQVLDGGLHWSVSSGQGIVLVSGPNGRRTDRSGPWRDAGGRPHRSRSRSTGEPEPVPALRARPGVAASLDVTPDRAPWRPVRGVWRTTSTADLRAATADLTPPHPRSRRVRDARTARLPHPATRRSSGERHARRYHRSDHDDPPRRSRPTPAVRAGTVVRPAPAGARHEEEQ